MLRRGIFGFQILTFEAVQKDLFALWMPLIVEIYLVPRFSEAK